LEDTTKKIATARPGIQYKQNLGGSPEVLDGPKPVLQPLLVGMPNVSAQLPCSNQRLARDARAVMVTVVDD
jgi:hypothetical protein